MASQETNFGKKSNKKILLNDLFWNQTFPLYRVTLRRNQRLIEGFAFYIL